MTTAQRVSRGFHRLGLFIAATFLLAGISIAAVLVLGATDNDQRSAIEQHATLVALNCAKEKLAEQDRTRRTYTSEELGVEKLPDGTYKLPEGWKKVTETEQWYYDHGYRNLKLLGCTDEDSWRLKSDIANATAPPSQPTFSYWQTLNLLGFMIVSIIAILIYGLVRAIGWVIGGFAGS